tara:strand:- start:370 stop:942 length:573 start_codon:yes stop_codon:yes gene_type:complete
MLSKNKIQEKFFGNKEALKIINIGRFTDQKDHLTLLRSINLIKNKLPLKLIIIGKGKNKEKIMKYIYENKLHKIVKVKNFLNNPYPYIKKSDIFILSSIYEGLPNVLLETMSLNKFIISSNCPTGPYEILQGEKNGLLFKVGNYKELSRKIIYYSGNKRKMQSKVKLAYKSLKRFDYKFNLDKYYKIISA